MSTPSASQPVASKIVCYYGPNCTNKDCNRAHLPDVCPFYLPGKCKHGEKCKKGHPEIVNGTITVDGVTYYVFVRKQDQGASESKTPTPVRSPFRPNKFSGPKPPMTMARVNQMIGAAVVQTISRTWL